MDGLMLTGERTVGPARCRVRQTNGVPAHLRPRVRELASLEVPRAEQGKGYATTLVHKVCREADAAGLVLVLWPQPWGDHLALSRDELEAWYGREFGFVRIQAEPVLMARQPGATPMRLQLTPVSAAVIGSTKGRL